MKPIHYLLILSGFAHALAHANDKLVPLTAGADPWPPYIDEKHPMGGVSVELADAAFRTQGYTVSNRILPWARAIEETKHGRLDLILDAWWNEERSQIFEFSMPYLNGPITFIKRKGDEFEYTGLPSLAGRSVALVRNYAYGDDLLNATHYEKFLTHNFMQSVQLLTLGRVDLTLENALVTLTRLKQDAPEMLEQIELVDQPLSDANLYVIAGFKHPKHKQMIDAFNKGMKVIIENKIYHQIMERNGLPVPAMFLETN